MWSSNTQQEETSTQVKRFACDRCHDQKLRCTRPQESEPCVRCARAGVFCNVSAAQRTGRPRKSSAPRSGSGRQSPSKTETADAGSSDNESKGSKLLRANSAESIREQTSPALPPLQRNTETWDTFASSSSSSISSISLPQQAFTEHLSTDDYADLLDCITDQAYFDNMDIGDFSDSSYLPTMQSSEPNPKKRKSNSQPSIGIYSNHMSLSPPILDNQTSACITSFPEIDMPLLTPAITTDGQLPTPDLIQPTENHSQTLSQLQSDIDTCSERIQHQARRMTSASTTYTSESQKLSEALGILLSTAERFIDLITCICRSTDHLPSRSPSPSWNYSTPSLEPSYFSSKLFSSARPQTLDPNLHSEPVARGLGTNTFYTMLKCHIRLLSAYDTTLDTMSTRLLDLSHQDSASALTSALSIGSFIVPFGAIIETLLHLQVISHQLDRLKTALHSNLLKMQPALQTQQRQRSLPKRLGLCRGQRSPSVSMVDFKLEEILERERALQGKLVRIENLAESSKAGSGGGVEGMGWA